MAGTRGPCAWATTCTSFRSSPTTRPCSAAVDREGARRASGTFGPMNNEWAILAMRASNDLLGDVDALRERMNEDSYLYFQGILDRERVLGLRREILEVLAKQGWVVEGDFLMEG